MNHRIAPGVLFLAILAVAGCEGPVGPQGDQGPQGVQGPQGIQGEQGEVGQDGAANVMSTAFVVDAGLFEGDDVMQYSIAMPAITESVLDEGVVLAYLGFDGSRWAAMPVVVPSFGSSTTLGFAFEISTFLLQLQTDLDDDHSDPSGVRALVASLFDGASVRVVTIPPTASKHDLDYADYEAVAKFYGID